MFVVIPMSNVHFKTKKFCIWKVKKKKNAKIAYGIYRQTNCIYTQIHMYLYIYVRYTYMYTHTCGIYL